MSREENIINGVSRGISNLAGAIKDWRKGSPPEPVIRQAPCSDQITRIMKKVSEGYDKISFSENKDIPAILLMGKTGSGKSTLAHILSGQELKAIRNKETGDLVLDAVNPNENIKIGHDFRSETKVPNKCYLQAKTSNPVIVWDCPGFRDTDKEQMIANSFYIKSLYNMHKSLKFVLVVPENCLETSSGRGSSFLELVEDFCSHFNDLGQIKDSVVLAITGVRDDKKEEHLKGKINKLLKDRGDSLDKKIQEMIGYFQKKDPIIFYAPKKEGELLQTEQLISIPTLAHEKGEYTVSSENIGRFSLPDDSLLLTKNLFKQSFNNIQLVFSNLYESTKKALEQSGDDNDVLDRRHEELLPLLPEKANYGKCQPKELKGDVRFKNAQKQIEMLKEVEQDLLLLERADTGMEMLERLSDLSENLFNIYEKYAEGHDLREKMMHFAYFIDQMKDYCSTFAGVLDGKQVESKSLFFADESIRECINELSLMHYVDFIKANIKSSHQKTITHLELSEEIENIPYYLEAIEIFKHYANQDEGCRRKIAQAYKAIGDIKHELGSEQDIETAIKCYLLSLNYNKEIVETYESLGDIYKEKGQFKTAIKFYEVIENYDKLKECFKILFASNPNDWNIRAEYADILKELGHFNKAQIYYRKALNLSHDKGIRKYFKNQIDKCTGEETLRQYAQESEGRLEQDIIFNFDKLDLQSFASSFFRGETIEIFEEEIQSGAFLLESDYIDRTAQATPEPIPFESPGHFLDNNELQILAYYKIVETNVQFSTLNANDLETLNEFLREPIEAGRIRFAAVNISANEELPMPGSEHHWVSYIEIYDENSRTANIFLINPSCEGKYGNNIGKIRDISREYFMKEGITANVISIPKKFQSENEDASSGIWALEFLEQVCKYCREGKADFIQEPALASAELCFKLLTYNKDNPAEFIQEKRELEATILFEAQNHSWIDSNHLEASTASSTATDSDFGFSQINWEDLSAQVSISGDHDHLLDHPL